MDPGIHAGTERLVAVARLAASLIVFGAILAGPGLLHSTVAKVAAAAFVLHSCAAVWTTWTGATGRWGSPRTIHVLDLAFATVVTSVSGGPAGHAFPMFAFVLVASAYRWGLRRTLLDSGLVIAIALGQSLAAAAGITPWTFELDWVVLWAPFLIVLAALVGALSDHQRALSSQAAATVRVVSRIQAAPDLDSAFRQALASTVALSGANEALLAMEQLDTRKAFLVHVTPRPSGAEITRRELTGPERNAWFSMPPERGSVFEARRPRRRPGPAVPTLVLDREGCLVDVRVVPPEVVCGDYAWSSVIGIAIDGLASWRGRLYLLDPTATPAGPTRLRFLQAFVSQVAPALVNRYLVGRLRSQAGSQERARVSRELHDGLVQSLLALDLGLDVLHRRVQRDSPELAEQMEDFRHQLHQEALNARDMMQRLRPVEVDRLRLPHQLQDLVERFGRSAGVEARLDWAVGALNLSPHDCREVVRLVQEALVNVRRHSGASRVRIRLDADASGWGLVIEDDGKGLGFSGRLTHEEMRRTGRGPRVIRERVEALGGEFSLESSDRGTRLEMSFPVVLD